MGDGERCIGSFSQVALSDDLELAGEVVPASYRLAAGDSVRITTFGHPDVSGDFEIDDDGFIKFPLLGLVTAAGRSLAELEDAVRDPLNEDFLVDPQVSIEILTFRPFYITGQVTRPGRYAFSSGMTVRQAVAMAHGYTRRARTAAMIVIRQTDDGTLRILNVDTSDTQGPVGLTIRADTEPSPTLRMMMDTVARVAQDYAHHP